MIEFFEFEGKQVRFVGTAEKPEWVAQDVCNCLGLSNTSEALSGLDEQDKGISKVDTPSGEQQMLTVFETGLYTLVFKSRKDEAKRFKRWTFEEVLPSIRKTGSYSINQQHCLPQTYLEALKCLVKAEEEKVALEAEVTHQKLLTAIKETHVQEAKKIIISQNEQIEEQKPKVDFYDIVADSKTNFSFESFAQVLCNKFKKELDDINKDKPKNEWLKIGRNTLFKLLRKYQFLKSSKSEKNNPYQNFLNMGIFDVIETHYADKKGNQIPKTTPKGQQYLVKWIKENLVDKGILAQVLEDLKDF